MADLEEYRRDLKKAQETLDELLSAREDIEVQIARTKRRIALLSELCDETGTADIPNLDLGGLTEACRTVLRGSAKGWMNTSEIMQGLRALGFPLDKYKAPMGAITTTVNRMVESGEVIANQNHLPGAREYQWSVKGAFKEATRRRFTAI